MAIYVTGAGGMLGQALVRLGARGWTRAQLDVTDPEACERALEEARPEAVIFCAALTDVDRCAEDPAAWAVNVEAPAWWAARAPTWLVSSNYVFDGPGPHGVDDAPQPINAYGAQKVEAERRVLSAGGHVVRTGWLFGPGGRNFPSTIFQRLAAGEVAALAGWPVQPTWVDDLAARLLELPRGVQHAVGEEETDWAGFAHAAGLMAGDSARVRAVDGVGMGPRPSDARLTPATLPGWRQRLPLLLNGG